MDDEFWDNEDTRRKMLEELRDPEKLRTIEEELRRQRIKDICDDLERSRHIDSFWLPSRSLSPWWPERLAYERRKTGPRSRHGR
jgi:small-conductance mechanosensitive channel